VDFNAINANAIPQSVATDIIDSVSDSVDDDTFVDTLNTFLADNGATETANTITFDLVENTTPTVQPSKDDDDNLALIVGLVVGVGVPVLLIIGAAIYFFSSKGGASTGGYTSPTQQANQA
jgi:hypothetical protein